MTFYQLKRLIKNEAKNSKRSFSEVTYALEEKIYNINREELETLIVDIGIIPEDIEHDSTEDKLYSKVSDILLARVFQELNLRASTITERMNCADVIAKSEFHNYTLVADAKTFRLSRTAKNQKDFKVKSMIDWKGDNDYAVIVAPYFQYPKFNSQIYGQALDNNVCLLSWEHLLLLLRKNLKESEETNFSLLWNLSNIIASKVTVSDKNKNENFSNLGNEIICKIYNIDFEDIKSVLKISREKIIKRGEKEISYWERKIKKISNYTREKAINELIAALKIREKILTIQRYVDSLKEK